MSNGLKGILGNIIHQRDDAQQTHYFNNQVVAPVCTYEYDALYRLIHATGRELTALQMPTQDDFVNNIPCPNPATNAMQNYTQHYQYDELGNILNVTSQGNWLYKIHLLLRPFCKLEIMIVSLIKNNHTVWGKF